MHQFFYKSNKLSRDLLYLFVLNAAKFLHGESLSSLALITNLGPGFM
jgi:hypothetical protein